MIENVRAARQVQDHRAQAAAIDALKRGAQRIGFIWRHHLQNLLRINSEPCQSLPVKSAVLGAFLGKADPQKRHCHSAGTQRKRG